MGVVEDISPKLRAQKYAKELGWEGGFIRYTKAEIVYRDRVAELRKCAEGPVNAEQRVVPDAVAFTSEVKKKARELGAELVGVCEVDQDYVYANRLATEKFALCFAIHMEYGEVEKAPHSDVSVEIYRVYELLAKTAVKLAEYLRGQGYPARAQVVGRYDIMLIPHAMAAGIGEQCRIGTLASSEFGPCMRLAAVLTNAPLVTDGPIDLGIRSFCDGCDICVRACPGNAIPGKRITSRGVEKWTLDPVKCMRWFYYNQQGCTICLKVCPLSKGNVQQIINSVNYVESGPLHLADGHPPD